MPRTVSEGRTKSSSEKLIIAESTVRSCPPEPLDNQVRAFTGTWDPVNLSSSGFGSVIGILILMTGLGGGVAASSVPCRLW